MFAVLKTTLPKRCPHEANPDGMAVVSQGIIFNIGRKNEVT